MAERDERGEAVAIIGMACRVPGADTTDEFWRNLRGGLESITFAEGGSSLSADGRRRVGARGVIHGVDRFDANFFQMSAAEATLTDPQSRVFLECAWEALERAGYDPARFDGAIGVYAGSGPASYLLHHVAPSGAGGLSDPSLVIANDKDHLTTRVAYKLGLSGPAITVQTTCSTSLVAVQLAWQALLTYQCDMALAGGVSIAFPLDIGYDYQEGFILSPDGHCRAFDARARGTVPGDGAGVVVLKRLSESIAAGDHIHAVLLGGAVNNDGSSKVGYTAPSVKGQAQVIAMAHAVAQIDAGSIGYIETHGTGTRLGDPIEVAALTQAFRETTRRTGFCSIGSVKTNLGHLNTAAGVVSLLKAALVVEHGEIPPSLHFEEPNPDLALERTPFVVNARLRRWDESGAALPRRAGVSSFGFGGTNAHVILEEPPAREPRAMSRPPHLLLLSARSEEALDVATKNLREHIVHHPDIDLGDVVFTLQVGRRAFEHRRMIVCGDVKDATAALENPDRQASGFVAAGIEPAVAFMFPGQGAQHAGMGRVLYEKLPSFRRHLDEARAAFSGPLGRDVLDLLAPSAGADLERTDLAQPAIAAVGYALARTWMDLGLKPSALVGNSLGEYVAACIAGVFSLEDMARLVVARGRLMQELPEGAMLSVPLAEEALSRYLDAELTIAATLAPSLCVVSGPTRSIESLGARLEAEGVSSRRLAVTRAFHSAMMDPMLPRFLEEVRRIKLNRPSLRYLSGLTGTWIEPHEAQSPSYWVEHLRGKTRLDDCLSALDGHTLLEVGPGRGMSAVASRARAEGSMASILSSLGRPGDDEMGSLLEAAGRLFLSGFSLQWNRLHAASAPRRVALPTYPFQRERYFVDAPVSTERAGNSEARRIAEQEHLTRAEQEIRASLAIRPIEAYEGLAHELDAFCASHVVHYLRASGVVAEANTTIGRDALGKTLHVLPKFERLLSAMLGILEEDGILRFEGADIHFTDKIRDVRPPAQIRAELDASHPQFGGIYRFIDHCAESRRDAMSGRIEAIGVLFPGGSSELVDSCERATVEHRSERIYIKLLCEAATRIADQTGEKRLRILEVGGGRGLLTFPLVEALSGRDIEYHFTDLGRVFVDDAREEATRRGLASRMRFGVLDISKDPGLQGYDEKSFDLIVAFNVVHATPDIGEAVDMLARLLAPRGTMALVELIKIRRWDTLTWGLAEGWWYFKDSLRKTSPLLDLGTWETFFLERGFPRVEAYPRDEGERRRVDHGLILARRELRTGVDLPERATEPRTTETSQKTSSTRSERVVPLQKRPDVHAPYLEPRTEVERKIAGIVGRLLGIDRVGVHDDLFALGADSLIMLRISDRIQREIGREVPASLVFRGATIEKISAALEGKPPPATGDSIAIPLQPRGDKRPLFFVHPAAGVVFPYTELSRQIGQDRPFFGLQARGLDGEAPPDTTIAQMAQRYAEAIRRVQPEGPYYVGGFSFGCLVAFEVAQELVRSGQRVEVVALVDEPAPLLGQRPSPFVMGKLLATGIARSIWPHLHDYFYLSRSARNEGEGPSKLSNLDIAPLLRKSQDGGWIETFLARSTMANYVPRESMLLALRQPAMLPMFRLFTLHIQETYAYQPRAYPGAVTLFKATRLGGRYDRDPTWGWGMLAAGGVQVFDVPGEHLTAIRKPHVDVLANKLRVCLEEADRRVASR